MPHAATAGIVVSLVILLGTLLGLRSIAARAAAMTFVLERDGLRVTAPMYGRLIPTSTLVRGEAKIVTLDGELAPKWRTNGIGMPGTRIGWFRLRNGAKALLYLYKTDTAVCVPTTEGHVVMLGVAGTRAEDLLAALKRA